MRYSACVCLRQHARGRSERPYGPSSSPGDVGLTEAAGAGSERIASASPTVEPFSCKWHVDFPDAVHFLPSWTRVASVWQLDRRSLRRVEHGSGLYSSGDKAGAIATFAEEVAGANFREVFDRTLPPGHFERWVAAADTLFQYDLPALQEWQFTHEDAARITQPVLNLRGANTNRISRRYTKRSGRGCRTGARNWRRDSCQATDEPERRGGALSQLLLAPSMPSNADQEDNVSRRGGTEENVAGAVVRLYCCRDCRTLSDTNRLA